MATPRVLSSSERAKSANSSQGSCSVTPEYGFSLVGFVDTPPIEWRPDIVRVPILGVIDDLASIVRTFAIDRVIVAFSRQNDLETLARVRQLVGLNVHVDVVLRMFEMIGPNAGLPDVEGIPLVSACLPAPALCRLLAGETRDRHRRGQLWTDACSAPFSCGRRGGSHESHRGRCSTAKPASG